MIAYDIYFYDFIACALNAENVSVYLNNIRFIM